MAPSGFISVGPVANNVVRYDLFMKVYTMVCDILRWDPSQTQDLSSVEYYKSYEDIVVPDGYYIHPERETPIFNPSNPVTFVYQFGWRRYLP